jgi:hypothetical protein
MQLRPAWHVSCLGLCPAALARRAPRGPFEAERGADAGRGAACGAALTHM